jgi:hypothetical protein
MSEGDRATNEPPAGDPLPSTLGPIALGIAVSVLVHFGIRAIPVASGEPLALRWARVLADHPVRAALAAALLVVALRPRAATPPNPADRSGAGDGLHSSH